jgi:pimeloyl-ACP methyl ester carboxylesterase
MDQQMPFLKNAWYVAAWASELRGHREFAPSWNEQRRSTVTQTDGISTQPGQFVPVNGLHMYYEECGSGKPLILLHGGTVTCHMWQPHLSCFVPHFRVITPDSRAQGRTDNPTGELSYRFMADDVAAFIQALGLTKPLVFGYSDGGQIALEIGMRYPNLTGGLVVGAAWYRFSETYLAFLKAIGVEGAGVVNIEYIQREMPDRVDLWKTEHARTDDPDYWQTMLRQLSIMWWTPLDYTAEDFQKITDPMLILLGDRDGTIELQQAVDMYRLIPNAELAILPNATHVSAIYSARSELTMKIVLDFLLRHGAQAEP